VVTSGRESEARRCRPSEKHQSRLEIQPRRAGKICHLSAVGTPIERNAWTFVCPITELCALMEQAPCLERDQSQSGNPTGPEGLRERRRCVRRHWRRLHSPLCLLGRPRSRPAGQSSPSALHSSHWPRWCTPTDTGHAIPRQLQSGAAFLQKTRTRAPSTITAAIIDLRECVSDSARERQNLTAVSAGKLGPRIQWRRAPKCTPAPSHGISPGVPASVALSATEKARDAVPVPRRPHRSDQAPVSLSSPV
jgi:hypothetical protein